MVSAADSPITVTIVEKDQNGEHIRLSGTGLFEFAHVDTNGNAYITGTGNH